MGSDSDLGVMAEAARVLDDLGVEVEMTIASAHRTPERAAEWARGAAGRGLKVIIAGAGGAAHLPGVLAALTSLPVVGVPIRSSTLDGLDSLLSIVQMPRGIPVATVGVNGARNAGLLAGRILALSDEEVGRAMGLFVENLRAGVEEKARRLEQVGYEAYLKQGK
jgi:phosphoribosylaminoimidazole carboxylase PurE protein